MHDNDDIMMDEDVCDGIPLDLHASDVPEIDTNVEHSQPLQIPESQYTQAEGEISQTYEGAPRQVNISVFTICCNDKLFDFFFTWLFVCFRSNKSRFSLHVALK